MKYWHFNNFKSVVLISDMTLLIILLSIKLLARLNNFKYCNFQTKEFSFHFAIYYNLAIKTFSRQNSTHSSLRVVG